MNTELVTVTYKHRQITDLITLVTILSQTFSREKQRIGFILNSYCVLQTSQFATESVVCNEQQSAAFHIELCMTRDPASW